MQKLTEVIRAIIFMYGVSAVRNVNIFPPVLRCAVRAGCLLILLFIPQYLSAFDSAGLDAAVSAFEKTHGSSAAVILEASSARICYVYNEPAALTAKFPPGSIAKAWSAAYFLENGSLLKTAPVFCGGKYYLDAPQPEEGDVANFNLQQDHGKYYFRCSVTAGHGNVTFRDALVKSCNVYFLTAASREPEMFYRGFNSLWHFTQAGETQNATGLQYAAATIGEGGMMRVTPVTAARNYAALFEGTPLLVPHRDANTPRAEYPLAISPASRSFILSALSETVRTGTLKGLSSKHGALVIAGKTGTATQYRRKYMTHGWTIVYFEFRKVRYVLVVFVEKGNGPKDAKLLAGEILNAL